MPVPPINVKVVLPIVALVGVLVSLFGAVGATATTSIQEKRAQAQAILEQVQQLDGEVGDAAERWNGANFKLGQIRAELDTTKHDLVRAKAGVKISKARAGARLRELYVPLFLDPLPWDRPDGSATRGNGSPASRGAPPP